MESNQSKFDYSRPLSHYIGNDFFAQYKVTVEDGKTQYHLSNKEKDWLEDIAELASSELTSYCMGVSGLGQILAIAADNEDAGLELSAVEHLGWLLKALGNQINDHESKLAVINDMLKHTSSETARAV